MDLCNKLTEKGVHWVICLNVCLSCCAFSVNKTCSEELVLTLDYFVPRQDDMQRVKIYLPDC